MYVLYVYQLLLGGNAAGLGSTCVYCGCGVEGGGGGVGVKIMWKSDSP